MSAADEIERIRAVYARRAREGRDDRYTLFEPAHLFQAQALERATLAALQREGYRSLAALRILDVGCGGGSWLAGLVRYGATPSSLVGVDLRDEALPRKSGMAHAVAALADRLPFPDGCFDLVCQLTVLSSVRDLAMRRRIASEMVRVLRPAGIVLWYDFTVNPFNHDVAGIRPRELRALFPEGQIRARKVTLAPPLMRLLARRAWLASEALEAVPWLRTHVLATIRTAHRGP